MIVSLLSWERGLKLIGNKYGVSDGMKAEMTLAALKGKVMLYEQDGKIYLVDSREETTGGKDNE